MLKDVGGLLNLLTILGLGLMFIYHLAAGDELESTLMQALLKKEKRTTQAAGSDAIENFNSILSRRPMIVPSCGCLRSSRLKRMDTKGWKRIEKELDFVEFVKTQMRAKIVMKALLTPIERYLVRNNRNFIVNSASSGSEENESGEELALKKQFLKQRFGDYQHPSTMQALLDAATPKVSQSEVTLKAPDEEV